MKKPYTGSFSLSDEVSHGLIIRQPYTGSFLPRWSFTRTHHQATLHMFLPSKMKFYTDSSSGDPTQVPSFQDEFLHGLIIRRPYTGSFSISDEVLHGLIIRWPYTGSFSFPRWSFTRTHHQATLHRFILFPRWSFTQTRHQATLHRFLPPFQMQFYTESSSGNPTQVPPF